MGMSLLKKRRKPNRYQQGSVNTLDGLFSVRETSYGSYLHDDGQEYFWRSYRYGDDRRLTFILADDGSILDVWHQDFGGRGTKIGQMPKPIGLAEALRLSEEARRAASEPGSDRVA